MKPQDAVAIILALGVMFVLMSGTNISALWLSIDDRIALKSAYSPEEYAFWQDITNVILGALAGYIAGRGPNGGS